jgi:flagellar biosynthesis protein FlhG
MTYRKRTEVIGIASGKGGAGKTTVAVNLSLALKNKGFSVMLFDADLALPNALILLGTHCPYNISHVLGGEKTLTEIAVTTTQGLRLISGASGNQSLAALDALQAAQWVQAFDDLEEELDYLIVDMPTGIHQSMMMLMAACHRRFMVVRNDPASIADAYGTIKLLMADGLDEIYLLPNEVPNQQTGESLFHNINRVCAQFLPRAIQYVGTVEHDDLIHDAHMCLQPLTALAPSSRAAQNFYRLAQAVTALPAIQSCSGRVQYFCQSLAGTAFLERTYITTDKLQG